MSDPLDAGRAPECKWVCAGHQKCGIRPSGTGQGPAGSGPFPSERGGSQPHHMDLSVATPVALLPPTEAPQGTAECTHQAEFNPGRSAVAPRPALCGVPTGQKIRAPVLPNANPVQAHRPPFLQASLGLGATVRVRGLLGRLVDRIGRAADRGPCFLGLSGAVPRRLSAEVWVRTCQQGQTRILLAPGSRPPPHC